jgi:hypothetical protein
MDERVRRLGDRSGNTVTCTVREDGVYEAAWPDGASLRGKSPRPWDAVLRELDAPRYSLVRQAMDAVRRARKSA